MELNELTSSLRDISNMRSASHFKRTICKMAAQRLEAQQARIAQLEAELKKEGEIIMKNEKKFILGGEAWVVERDDGGNACEVSGYVFLAQAGNAVILTPYINDLENLEDLLDYHIEQTRDNYETDLAVFPADDCYTDRESAMVALKAELETEPPEEKG